MKRKLLILLFLSSLVLLLPTTGSTHGGAVRDGLLRSKVTITYLDIPDEVNAGQQFMVNITIRNERILPLRATLRVDLLDGVLQTIQKNISQAQIYSFPGKHSTTIEVPCLIREGDVSWLQQKYNIQAVLYRTFPILGRSIVLDSSQVQGVHINPAVLQTYKMVLKNISVPETIAAEKQWFTVTVDVSNQGTIDLETWVSVDLIEKPSAIPQLEQLGILKGLATEMKELGTSNHCIISSQNGKKTFIVNCSLRQTDQNKTKFIIQVFLYTLVEGSISQSDVSSFYEIYHYQSFSWRDNILWIVGGFFGILLAIVLIAVIIRIFIPYYHIQKMKLKKEKDRIDRSSKK